MGEIAIISERNRNFMNENPKISVLILDYLKSTRVVENVKLLQKQNIFEDMEIIVVDNSCNKTNRKKLETLTHFTNVQLIFNEKNLGYTQAYNKVAALAKGEMLFIVNPDILVRDVDVLEKMYKYLMENSDIAILGPKEINEDGTVAMTVRAFPKFYIQVARRTFLRKLPFLKQKVIYDEMQHLNYEEIQEVDWLQSSFVAVRKDFWDDVNGFNENYFLFMSDPELCWAAWHKGKKVVYYPEVVVYADGIRVSSGGFFAFFKKWTMRQHVMDSMKYRWKHLFQKNPRLKNSLRRGGGA